MTNAIPKYIEEQQADLEKLRKEKQLEMQAIDKRIQGVEYSKYGNIWAAGSGEGERAMTDQEPTYSCRNELCAQEVSYHADMLRHHPESGLVCEPCWDDGEDGSCEERWSDLPEFISHQQELSEARTEAAFHSDEALKWSKNWTDTDVEREAAEDRATKAEAARDEALRLRDEAMVITKAAVERNKELGAERDELARSFIALQNATKTLIPLRLDIDKILEAVRIRMGEKP